MMAAPAPYPDLNGPADPAGEPTPRGGTMSVYPDRLRHNAEVLRRAYGPRMIAVIKGDGYGLGLVTCAAAPIRPLTDGA